MELFLVAYSECEEMIFYFCDFFKVFFVMLLICLANFFGFLLNVRSALAVIFTLILMPVFMSVRVFLIKFGRKRRLVLRFE